MKKINLILIGNGNVYHSVVASCIATEATKKTTGTNPEVKLQPLGETISPETLNNPEIIVLGHTQSPYDIKACQTRKRLSEVVAEEFGVQNEPWVIAILQMETEKGAFVRRWMDDLDENLSTDTKVRKVSSLITSLMENAQEIFTVGKAGLGNAEFRNISAGKFGNIKVAVLKEGPNRAVEYGMISGEVDMVVNQKESGNILISFTPEITTLVNMMTEQVNSHKSGIKSSNTTYSDTEKTVALSGRNLIGMKTSDIFTTLNQLAELASEKLSKTEEVEEVSEA